MLGVLQANSIQGRCNDYRAVSPTVLGRNQLSAQLSAASTSTILSLKCLWPYLQLGWNLEPLVPHLCAALSLCRSKVNLYTNSTRLEVSNGTVIGIFDLFRLECTITYTKNFSQTCRRSSQKGISDEHPSGFLVRWLWNEANPSANHVKLEFATDTPEARIAVYLNWLQFCSHTFTGFLVLWCFHQRYSLGPRIPWVLSQGI